MALNYLLCLVGEVLVNYKEAHELFRQIEDDLNLFDARVDGFSFWEYLRVPVWYRILEEVGITEKAQFSGVRQGIGGRLIGLFARVKNSLLRNPFLVRRRDFLFYGADSSRGKVSEGKRWDIHCDPFMDALGQSCCHRVERSTGGMERVYSESLSSTDFFSFIYIFIRPFIRSLRFSHDECLLVSKFNSRILEAYALHFDLVSDICLAYTNLLLQAKAWRLLLKCAKPKVAFVVCSYAGRESFTVACRDLNVPVIELQHGVINSYHLGYSYPPGVVKAAFPDYFFSFGAFWHQDVCLPCEARNVKAIGYPYFDVESTSYRNLNKQNIVLFISQGNIGHLLSVFAVELSKKLPDGWEIVYKLHPGEVSGWEERNQDLAESTIQVVVGGHPSMYELMARAKIQIGVSSTAIFEGLALECRTYIIDLPASEYMEALFEAGCATLISHVEEVEFDLTSSTGGFNSSFFFAENSISNFREMVRTIVV